MIKSLYNLFINDTYSTKLPYFAYKLKFKIESFKKKDKDCRMIHKYIYTALGTLLLCLIVSNVFFYQHSKSLESKIAMYETQIKHLNSQIALQNEAIEKLALDTQEYKDKIAKEKQALESKYNKIAKKLDKTKATCDEQIANINMQLNAFVGLTQ